MSSLASRLRLLTLLPAACFAPGSFGAESVAPPRLAVVIAVDQLRYDYLVRFRPYFAEDGFERLLSCGTNFENCTYRYASTKTAVGHATMLSGCNPDVHGIVGNEWVDRETLLSGVAVEDVEAPLVGLAPSTMRLPGGTLDPRSGRSPRRMLAASIGDQLKAVHGATSKVLGVSNKDRSAILMAGARADGAYWDESGRFVTSRYYHEELPAWVEAFNERRIPDSFYGKTFDRLLDSSIYDAVQGPDDAAGEYEETGLDRTFPHRIDGGELAPRGDFFTVFDASPFSSEFLAAFAEELILQENLGQDTVPDLLCISFSQIDVLGHAYGPDSHEIMDAMIRLDRILAGLFRFLDQRVGPGRFVIVLTSDHGVAPMPERTAVAQPRIQAERIRAKDLDARMADALNRQFGPLSADEPWFVHDNEGYHFRPDAIAAKHLTLDVVSSFLRDALKRDPVIETAYTRAEIHGAHATTNDPLLALVRRSYLDGRGQDVVYVIKPFFVKKSGSGAQHGTPWIYDRHVPQLWYGAGVPRSWRAEPVGMEDIAPTLAAILGIPPPPQATGQRLF